MDARQLKETVGGRGGVRPLYILVFAAACALFAHSRAADKPPVGPGAAAKSAKKPNIVFILTDDLSTNLVQYMPNVLAMQKEGTTFSNYFVTDSLCCPSRSSIFTGKFPHNTGVFTNTGPDGGYAAFNQHGNESLTFAVALKHAGYKTAMLGKYLNGYFPRRNGVPSGWNEWDVGGAGYPEFNYVLNQNGRVARYGSDPRDYLTDVVAGLGNAFIHKSAGGAFFIEIATFAPHGPYIPAPRDADKFPGLTAPRSPAFGARPDADAPKWLQEIAPLRPIDIQAINKAFRMRAQSVQAVDQMIGQIRWTLASLGLDQNTYIIFSSDNGLHMGEYSLRPGKMTPFEIDIHVPLIVVGPGVAQGQVVNEIVENIDLYPTFTELAEASNASPDGHSLVPLLRGSTVSDWRHLALIEHHHHGPVPDPNDPDAPAPHAANPPNYEALRIEKGMYVEYDGGEVGYYDLIGDPNELRNIAARLPAAQRRQLHDVLNVNKQCRGAQECWDAQRLALPDSLAASQAPPGSGAYGTARALRNEVVLHPLALVPSPYGSPLGYSAGK